MNAKAIRQMMWIALVAASYMFQVVVISEAMVQDKVGAQTDLSIPGPSGLISNDGSRYVPDQLIVKFRSGSAPAKNMLLNDQSAPGDAGLNLLVTKYKVQKIEPLFKKSAAPRLTADGQAKLNAFKYPERQNRVPPGTHIPDLENIYILKAESGIDILKAREEFKKDPNVEYAELNYRYNFLYTPDDTYFSSSGSWGQDYRDMWGLEMIDAERGWDIATGRGVVVAVNDSGVDYNHEDLIGNLWGNEDEIPGNAIDDDGNGYIDDVMGWDFASQTNDPMDTNGHGTHVAGTIAAIGNNAKGIVGVAFGSRIMALKTDLSTDQLVQAIAYAADNGADVMNNSWGGPRLSRSILEAMEYAYANGCVIVAAAGNSDLEDGIYPANYPQLISVAALDHYGEKAKFSSWGPALDVAAPGGDSTPLATGIPYPYANILSLRANGTDGYGDGGTILDEYYIRYRGTSMATPHVVGLAALILSQHPEYTNEQVRQVIRRSADRKDGPEWDPYVGYGRIDVYEALLADPPCAAKIIYPPPYADLNGIDTVDIKGIAAGPGFGSYKIELGEGALPDQWVEVTRSYVPVEDGVLLSSWDVSGLETGDYTLKLTVAGDGGREFCDRVFFKICPDIHEGGWPVEVGYPSAYPVIADINEDGMNDLIQLSTDGVYVFDGSGDILPGWPVSKPYGVNNVAVGDVDPSYEGKEIVVVYGETSTPYYHHVAVYHADGTEVTTGGWPKTLSGRMGYDQAPVIADLNNDVYPEIILCSTYKNLATYIQIFNFNGDVLTGAPAIRGISNVTPAVGNIDLSPNLEIVVSSRTYLSVYNLYGDRLYYRGHRPGTYDHADPIIADLDGDLKGEIIVSERPASIVALNEDMTCVSGWPVDLSKLEAGVLAFYNAPSVGDLDGDGYLEVVVPYGMVQGGVGVYGQRLVVVNHDGTIVPGWPVAVNFLLLEVLIADIDGDADLELIAPSFINAWYAWHHDGKRVEGWPISLTDDFVFSFGGLALGDMDGDGDTEVAGTTFFDSKLCVYTTPGLSDKMTWPMLKGNPAHTGCFTYEHDGDVNDDGQVTPGDALLVYKYWYGQITLTPKQLARADVNRDLYVTFVDANEIYNHYMGRPSCF
ncbi:MAG: S8 family serine peptidase [Candidatus Omnitrophota bacterium]